MLMLRITVVFLISLVIPFGSICYAHPVPYKGAVGAMTWNQSFMSDNWLTYSFRSNMAAAGRFMRMVMPDGEFRYNGAQLDYLAYRSNGVGHQANLYLYAGAGAVHFQNNTGGAAFYGLEADIEDRKRFAMLKVEQMNSSLGPDFSHVEGRLGIAPYEAEYNEIASWFMVQAQWHPSLVRKFAVTPLARFFYKSALWEVGVSTDGDWMLNFMFHL